jgi:hypothetical protein
MDGRCGNIRPEGAVLTVTHSTVSGHTSDENATGIWNFRGTVRVANRLVADGCFAQHRELTSNAYNIESTGDTCGFDQSTDLFNVSAEDLRLGELEDNGGHRSSDHVRCRGAGSFESPYFGLRASV